MPDLYSLDGDEIEEVPPKFALYPFGVFTTFVAAGGSVLGWREHTERLAEGAYMLWGHELDEQRLTKIVRAHLARVRGAATVRVTIYPSSLSLAAPKNAEGCRILVSSGHCEFPFVPSSDFTVRTVEYVRDLARVKSTSLSMQIWLRREAQLAGYDDALFRQGDEALEGTTWSLLTWRHREVATPAGAVLQSITAGHIGRIAAEFGWRFRRRAVNLSELTNADLVLAVNANSPARAIRKIDNQVLSVDEGLLTVVAEAYSAAPRELVAAQTDGTVGKPE